ncbi:acyltransferase family protein [Mucilaginibacter dorajii]|uniref:acyltransferase family protein n=1 Tax=Mucilaginibacter dorajii TaxID=692994 RepID=UPI00216897C9|nr:acyltransferase [Mucilaginibacter dorajii]MCS3737061.1 peptidoglycan/LPS O-acetylase OafA/YrhL [Mucilaginibacter dorajii]
MEKHRIKVLDGFRFIAVISVLLYHLTNPLIAQYPHHDFFLHIFKYGGLGVQFFFMISGFVISYTLAHTPTVATFYRNRFSRLFPAMLLCSLLTFIVARLINDPVYYAGAKQAQNLIPGLSFINPSLWNLIIGSKFSWINGSYWTLWVELQFYIIASALYFINKAKFFRNMLWVGVAISITKYLPGYFLNNYPGYLKAHGLAGFFDNWRYGNEVFNITFFIAWFLAGVIFYRLYIGINIKQNYWFLIYPTMVILCLLRDSWVYFQSIFYAEMFAGSIMIALFLLLIYKGNFLSILENSFITRIGVISYSIYLIHEVIGILLINKYSHYLGSWAMLSPFIIIVMVIAFAELSYRFYETKIARLIKKAFGN